MSTESPFLQYCGWIDHPERHAMAAALPWPTLAQAAPGLTAPAGDVFLYKAWKSVLGDYPKYKRQECGDCTSHGSGHALDCLQCIEIFLNKQSYEFRETCTEAIYGIGREIAGLLRSGDGCYGVAVAKALTDFGAVPREVVGAYDGNRAKQWGSRGVPAEIKKKCAEFKLGAATLVTTLDELDAALGNLYPTAGGFSQGFTMVRDSQGRCKQSGKWGHEQCCLGKRTRNGRREYLLCQSWGPNVPSGPLTDDQPDFSFWIDQDAMTSILSQRDFLAFAKFGGFVKRPVPKEWTFEDLSLS